MQRVVRSVLALALFAGLATSAAAEDKKGRPVTIRVVDEDGQALPNATVRVPGTEGKRRVTRNGEWTESMLYTVEGDEFVFRKNEFVEFHIAAPEFHARSIKYKVRGRMNYLQIALKRMPPPLEPLTAEDDNELLVRWFQRTAVDEPSTAQQPDKSDAEPGSR
jgi:hypothetical protein